MSINYKNASVILTNTNMTTILNIATTDVTLLLKVFIYQTMMHRSGNCKL